MNFKVQWKETEQCSECNHEGCYFVEIIHENGEVERLTLCEECVTRYLFDKIESLEEEVSEIRNSLLESNNDLKESEGDL